MKKVFFTEREFEYNIGYVTINGNTEILMKEGHECVFYNPSYMHNGFPQRMAFYHHLGFDHSVQACIAFLEKHGRLIEQVSE